MLGEVDRRGLYPSTRTVTQGLNEPECTINGKQCLSFCSNNYLSLTHHSQVKRGAIEAIQANGVGPGHSRLIGGTPDVVESLEVRIAEWTGFEDCLTFPTGYMANMSVFQAVLSPFFPNDPIRSEECVIFHDQNNHGSLFDGSRLTGAKIVLFRHNDLVDLQRKIDRYRATHKLIVTEGVFCLEGLITDLPRYAEIAHAADALLMVDDAHGVGILGRTGGGAPELHGCARGIDIYMGCMDKAMGGTGGFLCGTRELIRFLRVACRSSSLSSCLPAMMAGAMLQAVDVIRSQPQIRADLLRKSARLKQLLLAAGFCVIGNADHPAVSVLIGDDALGLAFERRLWDQKVFQPIMRWPAVPMNRSRFRLNVMANHTVEHLEFLTTAMIQVRNDLGSPRRLSV